MTAATGLAWLSACGVGVGARFAWLALRGLRLSLPCVRLRSCYGPCLVALNLPPKIVFNALRDILYHYCVKIDFKGILSVFTAIPAFLDFLLFCFHCAMPLKGFQSVLTAWLKRFFWKSPCKDCTCNAALTDKGKLFVNRLLKRFYPVIQSD